MNCYLINIVTGREKYQNQPLNEYIEEEEEVIYIKFALYCTAQTYKRLRKKLHGMSETSALSNPGLLPLAYSIICELLGVRIRHKEVPPI
jgi:hypothetical protein